MPTVAGLVVDIIDQEAVVSIQRDFDEGVKRDEWSEKIIDHLGSVELQALVVDLGRCSIISSTVIAGLVHLYDHYKDRYPKGVVLRHCTKHVQKILQMMRLLEFFTLRDPLDRN